MKSIIITLAFLSFFPFFSFAEESHPIDTSHSSTKNVRIFEQRIYHRSANPRFRGHWSGFNLGFADFDISTDIVPGGNLDGWDLDRKNSLVMQFNLFQHSIRLNRLNNMGLVTGLGLEYQRFRFAGKNSIERRANGCIDTYSIERAKKSSFKNLYLTIPLIFEWQFPASHYHRAYIGAGFMGGLRLHTKTKVIYRNENGDTRRLKHTGSYSMNPVKADAVVRVGFSKLALWGSYTLTHMMEKNKAQEIHPYTIGFGVNF